MKIFGRRFGWHRVPYSYAWKFRLARKRKHKEMAAYGR